VTFLRSLAFNRKAQKQLGFERRNENWEQLIRKSVVLAEQVEKLAPALAGDAPNPEYPWPPDDPQVTPAEHTFEIWEKLQATSTGRQFLNLITHLFAAAETYL
jgi:hypothetical protein